MAKLVGTLLYTIGSQKVENEAKKDLEIEDPDPEQAKAILDEAEEKEKDDTITNIDE